MHDPVNRPQHYTQGGVECIDAIENSMSPEAFCGFLKANCIKYLWRYEHKNGLEDLQKAEWYLQRLIKTQKTSDSLDKLVDNIYQEVVSMEKNEVNYDPDDYLQNSGCPDGFCPLPFETRQGPPEPIFSGFSKLPIVQPSMAD